MNRSAHVREQLEGYRAGDALEDGHRVSMLALLSSDAAFSRNGFDPGHFTASCFVVDEAGRLLLHRHRRLGRWLQMGGHVDGEELPSQAALREAHEESGLPDLRIESEILDLDVHAIPAGRGEPCHDHFDVRYLARTTTPHRCSIDLAESEELAWVSLSRAAELMQGEESIRVIRKIERILRERSLP